MPQNGTLFGGRVKFKRGHMGGPDLLQEGTLRHICTWGEGQVGMEGTPS